MAQVKVVFYLPLRDNDGRDLEAEWHAAEDDLYGVTEGWTYLGTVQGAYKMADGVRSTDELRAYAVVIEEARLAEVQRVLEDYCAKTTQKAIYYEVQYHVVMKLVTRRTHDDRTGTP